MLGSTCGIAGKRYPIEFQCDVCGSRWGKSVEDGLQLSNVVLYTQPGGNGKVDKTFDELKEYAPAARKFVDDGGRYLGTCIGAYFVDSDL